MMPSRALAADGPYVGFSALGETERRFPGSATKRTAWRSTTASTISSGEMRWALAVIASIETAPSSSASSIT